MMKMKAIVLLAMMAVAMMAVSVSAWGQEDGAQGDGGGGSVGASERGDPVIKPLNPKPGEKITDRTPTIKARVFERGGQLAKRNILMFLDNHRVHLQCGDQIRRCFSYSRSKDLLTYTPDKNLSLRKHTVRIEAEPGHNFGPGSIGSRDPRAHRSWSFRIVD
jgi:hypothetical protein